MGQQASKTDSVITDSSVEHINEKQKSSAFIGSRREQALSKGKGKAGVTEDVVEGWKKEFLRVSLFSSASSSSCTPYLLFFEQIFTSSHAPLPFEQRVPLSGPNPAIVSDRPIWSPSDL